MPSMCAVITELQRCSSSQTQILSPNTHPCLGNALIRAARDQNRQPAHQIESPLKAEVSSRCFGSQRHLRDGCLFGAWSQRGTLSLNSLLPFERWNELSHPFFTAVIWTEPSKKWHFPANLFSLPVTRAISGSFPPPINTIQKLKRVTQGPFIHTLNHTHSPPALLH